MANAKFKNIALSCGSGHEPSDLSISNSQEFIGFK